MQEGKRQKQIAGLLNEEMNTIFQKLGLSMIDGGLVSISSVKVTPDLLEARFYLSFFPGQRCGSCTEKDRGSSSRHKKRACGQGKTPVAEHTRIEIL